MKKTASLFMTMALSLGLMAAPVDVETAKQLGAGFRLPKIAQPRR